MAGDVEGLTDRWFPAPDWRAVKDARLGLATLAFKNATYMKIEYVLSEDGTVADSFEIIKQGARVIETIV